MTNILFSSLKRKTTCIWSGILFVKFYNFSWNGKLLTKSYLLNTKKPRRNNLCGFMVRPRGFEPPTSPLGGERSIQLSYERIKKPCFKYNLKTRHFGAPERIRTSNRSVRSRILYPVELRAHLTSTYYTTIYEKIKY